jgi:uncharacterized membrane protein YhaH (DUF805 family)
VLFTEAVRVCLNKYVTFSGRARRSEYWWFALLAGCVNLIATIVDKAAGTSIFAFAGLALILPQLAVGVRRLHDTNRSGWWYLLAFVPFGAVVILVFMCQDSAPVVNTYGPSPKSLTGSTAAFG